jgi:hypothetical protein
MSFTNIWKVNIPGHGSGLQPRVSFQDPSQSAPPPVWGGYVHERTRELLPPPHGLLHVTHEVQCVQPPSTTRNITAVAEFH